MRRVCRRLRGRVHPGRRRRPGPRPGRRRPPQLPAGGRASGEGENFLGSDVAAFIEHTREAIELGQDQVVDDHPRRRRGHRLRRRARRRHAATTSTGTCRPPRRAATTGSCARRSSSSRARSPTRCWAGTTEAGLLQLDEIRIVRGRAARRSTRSSSSPAAPRSTPGWSRSTPSSTGRGSRARSSWPASSATATRSSTRTTLVVAICQSGETADTLMAIRHAREQRAKVLAICNTNGSTIPRESDAVIYTHAGPEIGVASTKGFLTQLVACYLLGLYLAQVRGTKYGDEIAAGGRRAGRDARPRRSGCSTTPSEVLRAGPASSPRRRSVLFLGRHVGYPVALEGALKLKELAYIHAEGFAAGELKHGPIALIEEGLPVFVRGAAAGPRPAARQDGQQHPGDPGPRRAHHRARRGGRRRRSRRTPTS